LPKLKINGQAHEVDGPPDMPLLWAIRDVVGLTGTKFGCGEGLCGACTVHIDGVAARSCLMPIGALEGHEVTTIESLGGNHPLQEAWVACEVPQCGYCQSGQIMQAAGLLAANPNPSDDEVRQTMAGNICRCGTYNRIRCAIQRAAAKLRDHKA
jgi:isoquinoline 1-oxidoreductase alpha subunit